MIVGNQHPDRLGVVHFPGPRHGAGSGHRGVASGAQLVASTVIGANLMSTEPTANYSSTSRMTP
jgi:hypothetical protein